jgi:hypothetical protein
MSIVELKSSLAYIYYSFLCFLIQIYSSIENLRIIHYYDSLMNQENSFKFSLIIISFTIIGSSISNLLNLFNGFGNSIEDYPIYKYKTKKSFPLLTLFDIFNGILILLPKLIINTLLIKLNLKDQSRFDSFYLRIKNSL